MATVASILTLAFLTVSVTSVLRARCLHIECCERCDDSAPAIAVGGCDRVAPAAPAGLGRLLPEPDLCAPVVVRTATPVPATPIAPVARTMAAFHSTAGPPGGLALRI